jgi:hypothetical protein
MNSRRRTFALAGVLTATALTGCIAIAGLTHSAPHPVAAPQPAQVQVIRTPAAHTIPIEHELGEVD